MKIPWFKEWGLGYYPISAGGWVITALALIFCVHIFLAVDQHSHSVSDTLYGVFPYIVPTFLLWVWLASKTTQKE